MKETETQDGQPLALAYRYLNRRERTECEMRRHLAQKGFDAEAIDETVKALQGNGQCNDARYVKLFLEDKRTLERWGSERIAQTLRARGISPELIEELCAQEPDEAERDRALALLQSRFPDPPRTRRDRDRAIGVMLRRGYDLEVALDALNAHARADWR